MFTMDAVKGRKGKICGPCVMQKKKKMVAKHFCPDCEQFQCEDCVKVHGVFPALANHTIWDAEHGDSRPQAHSSGIIGNLDQCSDHDETLKFYCVYHERVCCTTCVIENHQMCHDLTCISKQVAKKEFKDEASDLMSALETVGNEYANIRQHIKMTKTNMQDQIDGIPGQIDLIIEKLEKLKQSAMQQAKSAQTKTLDQLETIREKATEIHKKSNKFLQTLKNVAEKGTPEQLFIAVNVISNLPQQHLVTIQDQRANMFRLEFKLELDGAIQDILQEGTVRILTINKHTNVNDVQLPPMYAIKLSLLASVDLKQTGDDQHEPLYTGLTFLPEDRLVAVDNWNWKLYLMNEKLKKLGSPYMFDDNPQCVTAIGDDKVAVSIGGDNTNQIDILQISKSNTITLTKTLKTTSLYSSICLMNEDTFVVSTILDKRPVRMITMSGEEKDFPYLPEKEYDVQESATTYIHDRDILVFSDTVKNAVCLYEMEDGYATQIVMENEIIKEPRGVCTGPHGTFVICSRATHSLVQVSAKGIVIKEINIDMKHPCIVCMSQDGSKLAVTNDVDGEKKLQIYKLY